MSTYGTQVVYEPVANYFGADSFSYTVNDGNGGIGSGTVAVTVTWSTIPPDAIDDVASVPQGAAATADPGAGATTPPRPDTGETLRIASVSTAAVTAPW